MPADGPEVVRLAGVMFESMGRPLDDPGWSQNAQREFGDRLGRDMFAFVVDDPDAPGRLAASAAASIHRRLPRPGRSDFPAAYVQWVATEERHRGRGFGRAVMFGLVGALRNRGVQAVELHATPMAESLYLSLGFADAGPRALRIRDLAAWPSASIGS
jgi:GNAT superfamily N-acetyltransferase